MNERPVLMMVGGLLAIFKNEHTASQNNNNGQLALFQKQ
jgi:hypothetical protein